jgi:uncharacterized protein (UPF0335 family)|tara:strand:- start:230 stop:466 length:237 start_codon:yes stop_codon:yes gene_type:complete
MATIEVINEFIGKVLSIENEKVLLRETEKELYADYKDQLDPKAFRAAMRIAKIRVKLSGGEEDETDQILDVLSERVFS